MTTKQYKLGLHWMRHDIRINDNQALHRLSELCEQIIVVYVFDPQWRVKNQFGHIHMGKHRHIFLDQALLEVAEAFNKLNISFLQLSEAPVNAINQLMNTGLFDCLSYEKHCGFNELQQIAELKKRDCALAFIEGTSNYLLNHQQLPFTLEDMPDVFSPFRRKVEKALSLRTVLSTSLITQQKGVNEKVLKQIDAMRLTQYIAKDRHSENGYRGGQSSANKRIQTYFFESDNIANYKNTRNGLDGWEFSSRFSAFLAMGCVSPAYIYNQLNKYENERIKNESTYWLFFELLWREFFHLQSHKQGVAFFKYGGIQHNPPHNQHNSERFERWKSGSTGFSIVDAGMNQLAATGFMSNRVRQLAASCFVHELALDWRYGAAYFEEMLIDFDVASNYGNWQYLAGVGSDPRGHRQFNLDKQTATYDPQREFIKTWL